ncbi:ead/Ea22-like family protein [Escherichia coli]|nr:ead/Ea22-like family protein [Escherichia coli]
MSKIDYQALRELAKQATQGEWVAFISPGKYGTYAVHTPGDNHHGDIVDWPGFDEQKNAENNARYIAAFNPEVVQALLDELERNQQYIKRRDQENEDIALTVGKLRVELEAAKSKLNEQREYYEGVIADGSKRIAELESGSQAQKLVEAIIVAIENEQERLFDEDYLMDSKECIDVIREEVKRWNDSRAAGIRIKGE